MSLPRMRCETCRHWHGVDGIPGWGGCALEAKEVPGFGTVLDFRHRSQVCVRFERRRRRFWSFLKPEAWGLKPAVAEWFATAFALVGTALVTMRQPAGFVCWTTANLLFLVLAVRRRHWPQVALWGTYLTMSVWGLLTW